MRDTVPRPRTWVLLLTCVLGVFTAVLAATGMPAAELAFAGLNEQVQGGMSVLTPLVGILLVHDHRRTPDAGPLGPCWVMALLSGAAIAVFGLIVSAATVAIAAPGGGKAWDHAAVIVLGSVLVQIVAAFVGTGFGLLLRWKVAAFLSTIVFPIGLWWLLGAVDALRPARPWLTPLEIGRQLISGNMTAMAWLQWLVMALIWVVGLNLLGAALWKRRRA